MDTFSVLVLLKRLEQKKGPTIGLTPQEFKQCGLPAQRVILNRFDGNVLFYHVDRLKYIEQLKDLHQLFHKRSDLRRLLICR